MFTSVSSHLALSGWVSALENLGDVPQPVLGTFIEVTFIISTHYEA